MMRGAVSATSARGNPQGLSADRVGIKRRRARSSPAVHVDRGASECLRNGVHRDGLSLEQSNTGQFLAKSPEALLQACARGDQAALQSLYAATAPRLLGLAQRMVSNRALAEDLVQDTFILAWRHAHRFDPHRGAAIAWLATIVRRQCLDQLRRRRYVPLDDIGMENFEDTRPNPADLTILSRDAQRLRSCLDKLDPGPRASILMAYFDGLTLAEVSGRQGVPLGTVKSWVRRSLARLKNCMEQ